MRSLISTRRNWLSLGRLMLVFAVAAGTLLIASPANAAPPTRTEYTYSADNIVLTDVCSFPVNVALNQTITQIDYYDRSGALQRIFGHVIEQDTFTANGNTLVGLPFVFNVEILFDSSGNITHNFASGVVEKVWLPDGSLFISAGRLDWVQHPLAVFLLSPDKGNPGNVAGFCAALAQ
jgi:hypothetical protein